MNQVLKVGISTLTFVDVFVITPWGALLSGTTVFVIWSCLDGSIKRLSTWGDRCYTVFVSLACIALLAAIVVDFSSVNGWPTLFMVMNTLNPAIALIFAADGICQRWRCRSPLLAL